MTKVTRNWATGGVEVKLVPQQGFEDIVGGGVLQGVCSGDSEEAYTILPLGGSIELSFAEDPAILQGKREEARGLLYEHARGMSAHDLAEYFADNEVEGYSDEDVDELLKGAEQGVPGADDQPAGA